MGSVKLGNEVIPDRRSNGARIKLDLGDWWKIISCILVLIIGGAKMQWTVNNHSQALAEQIKVNNIVRDSCKDIEFLQEKFVMIDHKLDRIINAKYSR